MMYNIVIPILIVWEFKCFVKMLMEIFETGGTFFE